MKKHAYHPTFQIRSTFILFPFTFILMTFMAACSFPGFQNEAEDTVEQPAHSDPNARMYQMYFDSSADPAQNELQVRRFVGQIHLASLEDTFGDIQSLPLDDNCNYSAGPVMGEDGMNWFVTVTPDLVGVNLVSAAPDGTVSSAFDLDGDRIVDILDIRLPDDRRFSIVNELNGLEAFKDFLGGLDPFCSTELIQQLDLPDLGCDEAGGGSSGVGDIGPGSGISDPIDDICSQYNTGPGRFRGPWTKGRIYEIHSSSIVDEGDGVKETHTDQHWDERLRLWVREDIVVHKDQEGNPYEFSVTRTLIDSNGTVVYTHTRTRVKDPLTGGWEALPDSKVQEGDGDKPDTDTGSDTTTQGDPGPEGNDDAIAIFCEERANHRSGVEQAAEEDPTSMSVSCNDLAGDPDMPDDPNCTIVAWARPDDFQNSVEPSSDGCDPFQTDDTHHCETGDVIGRFRGYTAELRSINVPEMNICPQTVCDPNMAAENRVYIAGEIEIACPVVEEPPALEPSEENCPPGTYYAPVTNRCIEIQIPDGGSGGRDGKGGGCNLSVAKCSKQGLSFDGNSCQCVPIQ